ncbi:hypothetical protein CYMTET_56180 [Cymbomonas tetramitiformis]|uniref:Uncharacterized protein n=1 Tax=Cymbomonas tetramitiformis TaxID=36881 RepID=A0AAE0BCQ5_9CHLO|nr:hypothetical protein CYMTET_56180 [Cymbomonas tetramitiformis]
MTSQRDRGVETHEIPGDSEQGHSTPRAEDIETVKRAINKAQNFHRLSTMEVGNDVEVDGALDTLRLTLDRPFYYGSKNKPPLRMAPACWALRNVMERHQLAIMEKRDKKPKVQLIMGEEQKIAMEAAACASAVFVQAQALVRLTAKQQTQRSIMQSVESTPQKEEKAPFVPEERL